MKYAILIPLAALVWAAASPAQAQAQGVGLGVDDATLASIIAREEAEIVRRFGANYPGPMTETLAGGGRSLYLKRALTSVTTVVETLVLGDTVSTTLTTLDYYVWPDEGRLERLYGCWGALVVVTYVPADDTDLRTSVLLELVRIATEQTAGGGSVSGLGYSIASAGSSDGAAWARQRGAQYARLGWLSR